MQDFEVKKNSHWNPCINLYFHIFSNIYMGVSLNGGTPISHPKMIIFSRKNHGCWGNPSFQETTILWAFPQLTPLITIVFLPALHRRFLAEGLRDLNDFPYAIFVVRTKKNHRGNWQNSENIWKCSEKILKVYLIFASKAKMLCLIPIFLFSSFMPHHLPKNKNKQLAVFSTRKELVSGFT